MSKALGACLAALLLMGGAAKAEDEIHIVHCLMGCPIGAPATNDLVIRQIYALSSNDETKFADWAAYLVTRETMATSKDLDRNWQADPFLDDSETLEPDDYKGFNPTGTPSDERRDRGHLVPLASFAGTVFWRDTNILSNITPQKANLNQGAWVDLELAVRELTWRIGEVWVVTGPLYESPEAGLQQANEPLTAPSGYWKVIADEHGKMTAFIFDQDLPRATAYCDQRQPLTAVEARSALNLFPRAPASWPTDSLDAALGCN